jgi:hypothetical protein
MLRWSSLTLAMGFAGFSAQQAQAAIHWPGGGSDGNDKETDFKKGYNDGQKDCQTAPLECGVKLSDMIRNLGYGETEPNDHIINADGLLLGQFYHANSFDQFDEDWYYITTDRKNQKLTVYFLGDSGRYANTAGWLIQVRDLKGNIIASFDSTVSGGAGTEGDGNTSPIDLAKIAEVTLGKIGSYYISVKSQDDGGTRRGYHIGATLKNTGQVTAIEEENRFDTETEPNDENRDADVLRANVAMVGVFDRTLIKYVWVTTPTEIEYKYFYKGCDESDPATLPPGQTDCACDITKDPLATPNPNPPFVLPDPVPDDYCQANPDEDACDRVEACEAKAFTTPAETEKRGIFHYDKDVYVYHSEGDEQLRVQICTRTECEFDRVHLQITKDGSSNVLLEGPIGPDQVIDLGAALPGDYYFVLSPEEVGIDPETGEPEVEDLVGPYDILLMSTKLSPTGGTVPTSSKPPAQPKKPTRPKKDDKTKNNGSDDDPAVPFSWFNLFGG